MARKIVFVLPNLLTGGAQRVVVNLMENLSSKKFDVKLVVLNKKKRIYKNKEIDGNYISNFLDDGRTIFLESNGAGKSMPKLLSFIWKEKPDLIFSTISYVNMYLLSLSFFFPSKTKLVVRETNMLSYKFPQIKQRIFLRWFFALIFKQAYHIVFQSKAMQDDFLNLFKGFSYNSKIIFNPVQSDFIQRQSAETCDEIEASYTNCLLVGHLTRQKAYDVLIRAIPILNDKNFRFHIIGRGPEREKLKEMADFYGVSNQIIFHGYQKNPYKFMNKADVFVHTARFEGLPNAVLEAGILGKPLILSDCPGNIHGMITDSFGCVFQNENPDDLAAQLRRFKNMHFSPEAIAAAFMKNYNARKIGRDYDMFLSKIADD